MNNNYNYNTNYNQPVVMVSREKINNFNKTNLGVVFAILTVFAITGLFFIAFCMFAFPNL